MMKPVVHIVLDKNGQEREEFTPTAHMIVFAQHKARFPHLSDSECCKEIGLRKETYNNWCNRYGARFSNWLFECMDMFVDDKKAQLLEAVGMIKATQGEYQFWRDMARTHNVIKEEAKNEVKIAIGTTDFSSLSGKDLEYERERLLAEVRGLDAPRRSEVADGASEGEHEGMGDRVSSLPEECLVLSDSLVPDGERAERDEPKATIP